MQRQSKLKESNKEKGGQTTRNVNLTSFKK